MRFGISILVTVVLSFSGLTQEKVKRGSAKAEPGHPKLFPHRIWAACDFERPLPSYAWFGPVEKKNIPAYAGNATALGVSARPYKKFAGLMTGINPVPGPMMGTENFLFLRYHLTGATEATFQHYSLSSSDNNHIRITGLTPGKWSEVTMNFSKHGRRNDGTPGVPFKKGERMDDLKVFVGKAKDADKYQLVIDDVIFFANEPGLPPEPEPFPHRVMYLAGFDTGTSPKVREKFWPGIYDIVRRNLPEDSYWGVARAVPRKDGKGKVIQLVVENPTVKVGAHTKLRFRYHLTGASNMTVQMFDLTDKDNRHIHLKNLKPGKWQTVYLDFTRDSRRNDGGKSALATGHEVDLLSFLVGGGKNVNLLVDEVVLFDAGKLKLSKRQGTYPRNRTMRDFLRSGLVASLFLAGIPHLMAAEEAAPPLKGCRVAIIIATGYHDHEFWFPYYRFREAGAEVIVAGPTKGTVYGEGRNGKDGLPAKVTHTIEEIRDQRFDAIYLPGGIWAPLKLRHHKPTCELIRQALKDDVIVAAICHAPWVLISADVVKGRSIACPADMAVDVRNAGGKVVKDKCVRDGNLITAVFYGYLPEHFRMLMPVLERRMAAKRTSSK